MERKQRQRLRREDISYCISTYVSETRSWCILQTRIVMSKSSSGKSPLRLHDMERYMLHFVSHFMSSLDFTITHHVLQDVEELCSACQLCEKQLICAGLRLAFLLFLEEKQIKLLMLHSSYKQARGLKPSFLGHLLLKKALCIWVKG